MDSKETLIAIFSEMAVLLDLSGENPFKIRAYENAVRLIESGGETLEAVVAAPPKGIGKGLLEKITEFIKTGQIEEHLALKSTLPPGLFDLLKVQGLGPKKVKILYDNLGISTLEELEDACRQNHLIALKGFGQKTQDKILESLSFLHRFQGQFLFPEAEETATRVLAHLRAGFPETPVHIAGSLRRKKELVKDIDLLAVSETPLPIMKRFTAYPEVARVFSEGETKSSIQLGNGIQIDLRVVAPSCFGPAFCHFTGSKEHNTSMRALAQSLGKKLNEYGLFTGESAPPMTDEAEVYEALGLPFIPPELREDLGEMEWAKNRNLPALVEEKDIIGALHGHSIFSDGTGGLPQMVAAARAIDLAWFGISDHSQSAFYARGMTEEKVKKQWEIIDEYNSQNPGFKLLKGLESDILPDGSLDFPPEILAGFDFVIASIHSHFSMSREEMTARIMRAVENPRTDILGHPTGRLLMVREPFSIDLDAILAHCVKHGVAVEINANPVRLDLDWRKIRTWRDSGLKFVIGPDAHSPDGIKDIQYGLNMARKGGLEPRHLLNCLSLSAFQAYIRARRQSP